MTYGPPDHGGGPGAGSGGESRSAERGRTAARGLGTGAKVTARGMRGAARVTGRFGRFTVRQAQRAANAQGAEQSGLNRLIYLHAANAAGDAAVAISLATTVFFAGATRRLSHARYAELAAVPIEVVWR